MKKFTLFFAMLVSLIAVAEQNTATLSFADKANRSSFSTDEQVWEQNGIIFTNSKASSTNDMGDYANPVRCYKGSSITIAAPGGIDAIVFTAGSSSYANALKTSIGSAAVVNGTEVSVALTGAENSFLIAALTAQVRIAEIKVTYTLALSDEPSIKADRSSIHFPVLSTEETVKVFGQNLTEAIQAKLQSGKAFAIDGTLTAEGGTLTIQLTATEAGTYTDALVLTSGATSLSLEVSATIYAFDGDGSKERPYSISDIRLLGNPGDKVWVEGYIVGLVRNNKLVTADFAASETPSNIALADAATEQEVFAPIQLPTGDVRAALNLVDNAANLGKKVAVYGTLDAYFSQPGVKNVSEYTWVSAGDETALDQTTIAPVATKIIRNGQLLIFKSGIYYNLQGQAIQ